MADYLGRYPGASAGDSAAIWIDGHGVSGRHTSRFDFNVVGFLFDASDRMTEGDVVRALEWGLGKEEPSDSGRFSRFDVGTRFYVYNGDVMDIVSFMPGDGS